jgi:hypothetical protein
MSGGVTHTHTGRGAAKLAARHSSSSTGSSTALKTAAKAPPPLSTSLPLPVTRMEASEPKREVATRATSVEADVVLSSKDPVQVRALPRAVPLAVVSQFARLSLKRGSAAKASGSHHSIPPEHLAVQCGCSQCFCIGSMPPHPPPEVENTQPWGNTTLSVSGWCERAACIARHVPPERRGGNRVRADTLPAPPHGG